MAQTARFPYVIAGVAVDGGAVVRGAVLAAVLVVPAAIVANTVDEGSAWTVPAFLVAVAGFAVGGGVAGWIRPESPAAHGSMAAGAAVVAILAVSVARRLIIGDEVAWISMGATVLMAIWLGVVGGVLAGRYLAPRAKPSAP